MYMDMYNYTVIGYLLELALVLVLVGVATVGTEGLLSLWCGLGDCHCCWYCV